MVGAIRPLYHLLGNVISASVGLVYINLQPEYELSGSTRLGQFQKFEKFLVKALSPQPPLKKKFMHSVSVFVCSYLFVRFDLPSSINFIDINGVPKLGSQNPY